MHTLPKLFRPVYLKHTYFFIRPNYQFEQNQIDVQSLQCQYAVSETDMIWSIWKYTYFSV